MTHPLQLRYGGTTGGTFLAGATNMEADEFRVKLSDIVLVEDVI